MQITFLLPKKLAIVANKKNIAELENKLDLISKKNEQRLKESGNLKSDLDKINLKMNAEANDDGVLYGAVTQKQISNLLKAQGHDILNENIIAGEIKSIGSYEIKIKIYEDIASTINLLIEKK